MMYTMHSKTFLEQYINEDPELVLRTQYIIVSSHINRKTKYSGQVVNYSNILMPTTNLIVEYDDYNDEEYESRYLNQLEIEGKNSFAVLIKYKIDENLPIVFLTTKNESKYRHLELIRKYVWDTFGYQIYDYKKFKAGKEEIKDVDFTNVYAIASEIVYDVKEHTTEVAMESEYSRKKYFTAMKKKELIKELKERNLYTDDMNKEEMIETLLNLY